MITIWSADHNETQVVADLEGVDTDTWSVVPDKPDDSRVYQYDGTDWIDITPPPEPDPIPDPIAVFVQLTPWETLLNILGSGRFPTPEEVQAMKTA